MMFTRKAAARPWTAPCTAAGKSAAGRGEGGFTLIELMIVLTIIAILATIATPSYQRHVIRARETVLSENLFQMRKAIDAFYADHRKYPDTLQELAEKRYLRGIPRDPFTRSAQTWYTIPPELSESATGDVGAVFDVRSGSNLVGLNGVPYRDW